jgi:hypothetical protein
MDLSTLAREIKAGAWDDLLPPELCGAAAALSEEEVAAELEESCGEQGRAVVKNGWFDIYWSAGWVTALRFAGVEPGATVLEIGVGVSTNFARAASHVLGAGGEYVAVNLNRGLTEAARGEIGRLPIRQRFLEADAVQVQDHLDPGSCAFVALNHQLNDIVQTIVYERTGRTTTDGDWYAMVPEMVDLIRRARESGELERSVRPQVVEIVASCAEVLEAGGLIGFNNALVPSLLERGYSIELLGSFIPLARTWIHDDVASLEEVRIPGFHERWWMFFRRTGKE